MRLLALFFSLAAVVACFIGTRGDLHFFLIASLLCVLIADVRAFNLDFLVVAKPVCEALLLDEDAELQTEDVPAPKGEEPRP